MATATPSPETFAAQHEEGLTWVARFGYAAHGVVYVLVAYMVFQVAMGDAAEGTRGVLGSLSEQPGGDVVLGLVAVGLFGYALWRFCQGFFDADQHGSDAKGYAVRTGMVISGLIEIALGVFAISLIFGWGLGGGGGGGGEGAQNWTARLMAQPFGRWLVALVGVAVLAGAGALAVKGIQEKYKRNLMLKPDQWKWANPLCKVGLFARAIVFAMIGFFLIVAALQYDSSEARGLEGAIQTLSEQTYGTILLIALAIGLLAYAIYNFLQARYRIIHPSG